MKPGIEELLSFIAEAFQSRAIPKFIVEPGSPDTDIYQDAQHFAGRAWEQLTCAELQQYHSATAGFSPEAFCYFLPGIYSAGIKENQPNLIVNDALVGSLDRGNAPNSWDEFFLQRWPQLTPQECAATQRWLLWLSDSGNLQDIALSRAFDTLNLLTNQREAIPLAAWSRK
jgi:hypothetical protein